MLDLRRITNEELIAEVISRSILIEVYPEDARAEFYAIGAGINGYPSVPPPRSDRRVWQVRPDIGLPEPPLTA